jgi:hypothetical protein
MYPLSLTKTDAGGAAYAVASDAQEHQVLSAQGYEPAFVKPEPDQSADELESLRAQLTAKGIAFHHNAGVVKLRALLDESAA